MSMKGYSLTLENIEKYVEKRLILRIKKKILMKIILFPFKLLYQF